MDIAFHLINSYLFILQYLYQAKEAPLILWLEGGPGASAIFSVFKEIGPFNCSFDGENYSVDENPLSWHNNNSLLFIDSPVGTGNLKYLIQ